MDRDELNKAIAIHRKEIVTERTRIVGVVAADGRASGGGYRTTEYVPDYCDEWGQAGPLLADLLDRFSLMGVAYMLEQNYVEGQPWTEIIARVYYHETC